MMSVVKFGSLLQSIHLLKVTVSVDEEEQEEEEGKRIRAQY